MKQKTHISLIAWIIFLILVLVWGSSFILMKKGLLFFSSNVVAALRMSFAFLVLLPFSIKALTKLSKEQLVYLFIVGALSNAIPAFLFSYAQTGIDSSLAGILNSLTPISTMIIGLSFFKYKAKWYNILGVLIGFSGVIGLLQISGGKSFEFNFHYAKFIILATICYSININIVKYKLKELDSLTITSVALLLVGVPLLVYLLVYTDFLPILNSSSGNLIGLGYIALLGIFGTALALIAFNKLLKITNVVFAASVTYLIPVVAILWGIFDGEIFRFVNLLWIALIIIGVILVRNREENK